MTSVPEAKHLVRNAEKVIQQAINEQMALLKHAGLSVVGLEVPLIDVSTATDPFNTIVGMVRIKVTL